jgi:hypothetical protein
MKLFISWSGTKSQRLAEIVRDWIPKVIQAIKPIFSPEIEKGVRWFPEISKELEECAAGLIFLTNENLESPWLMFEAGALSKNVGKSRIIPLLFGIDATDIKGPLSQFQAAPFNKEEIRKLLKTLNSTLGEANLELSVLDSVFEKWWPDLESKISKLLKEEMPQDKGDLRSERDLLEEILTLVRALHYNLPVLSLQPIDTLGELSDQIRNNLKEGGIRYIGDLIQMNENDLLRPPYRFEKKISMKLNRYY